MSLTERLPAPAAPGARRHTARTSPLKRAAYLARIAAVYARPSKGPLSFWHETPRLNEAAFATVLPGLPGLPGVPGLPEAARPYWMTFAGKARYQGPFDADGVPLLDYRGDIGVQYNPIAIAQYGLARYNQSCETTAAAAPAADGTHASPMASAFAVATWLAKSLRPNAHGIPVWMHHFDWPYRQTLRAPWYSGLAQGCGLSMLVRAAAASTGTSRGASFGAAAHEAFRSMLLPVADGGVLATDSQGHTWIEEYLVDPPSHILNGFIWALWGVRDYGQWARSAPAEELWQSGVRTLEARLASYDTGWWSLYELPPPGAEHMLASQYYHRLHITQLRVLDRMIGRTVFGPTADRFEHYLSKRHLRLRAVVEKAYFKVRNY
jgi:heparosan-N-sulfate-glucuronate 5-epimerase